MDFTNDDLHDVMDEHGSEDGSALSSDEEELGKFKDRLRNQTGEV